jgi:CelD/BcsL family acetyltransferase involved in cellulose biosynthesis
MSESHDVEVVRDRPSLRALRDEWDAIAPPGAAEPWQSFNWIYACTETYSATDELHVVTIRRDGKLRSIAPLVLRESNQPLHPRRLEFLGGGDLKEPNRLISSDLESSARLADYLAAERTYPIRLSRVPNDRSVLNHLIGCFRRYGWITKTVSMPYPYVQLSADRTPIKRSLREDLARARRKAEARGPVAVEVVERESPARLRQCLAEAFQIEGSGWKGRNKTAIVCDSTRRSFFERYAEASLRSETLRLAFLRIGDEIAAVQYAIQAQNQYWLLNIGYRDSFRECSPGNMLLEETIKLAARNGLSRYNLLGKEETWTRRWTSDVEDCIVLAAYRSNYFGIRAVLSDALYLYNKRRQDRLVREIRRDHADRLEATSLLAE